MQFDHPSKESIDTFNLIQERKNNPHKFTTFFGQFTLVGVYYLAVFGAFFKVVNPYGRASRIKYEQQFSLPWRYGRKLVPFALLVSPLLYLDTLGGIL